MGAIIQICGTNGTGKTTLVKNILNAGNFYRFFVEIKGCKKEIWRDANSVIIGKYSSANCCGVDGSDFTSEQMFDAINEIIGRYSPEVLLFEDVRYGSLYSFKRKLFDLCSEYGYEYKAIVLFAEPTTIAKRVINRSGNPNVDFYRMLSKQRQCIRSANKLAAEGVHVVFVDTDKQDKNGVFNVVNGAINGL